MPILRRGLYQDPDYSLPIRPTLGPLPSAWDECFPVSMEGVGDGELDDGFRVDSIAPFVLDPNEQTVTREEYYRLRG